jgi:hypothetical protein
MKLHHGAALAARTLSGMALRAIVQSHDGLPLAVEEARRKALRKWVGI